ncbi:MAG TPA: alginate lyase family protein [Bdellovibrionota bacterium]|jgi:hypothetical protein
MRFIFAIALVGCLALPFAFAEESELPELRGRAVVEPESLTQEGQIRLYFTSVPASGPAACQESSPILAGCAQANVDSAIFVSERADGGWTAPRHLALQESASLWKAGAVEWEEKSWIYYFNPRAPKPALWRQALKANGATPEGRAQKIELEGEPKFLTGLSLRSANLNGKQLLVLVAYDKDEKKLLVFSSEDGTTFSPASGSRSLELAEYNESRNALLEALGNEHALAALLGSPAAKPFATAPVAIASAPPPAANAMAPAPRNNSGSSVQGATQPSPTPAATPAPRPVVNPEPTANPAAVLAPVAITPLPFKALPLPAGVPETTYHPEDDCYTTAEKVTIEAFPDKRSAVSGCTEKVINPSVMLSYNAYRDGEISLCAKVRENHVLNGHLTQFGKEVVAQADKAEASPGSSEELCAVNMFYTWAKADALTQVNQGPGKFGAPSVAMKNRMFLNAGIATAYFKHLKLRQRAKSMKVGTNDKDFVIRKWLLKIAKILKTEADGVQAGAKAGGNPNLPKVNTQFWRAYSMLPAGLLNGDAEIVREAKGIFQVAMREIMHAGQTPYDRGFLPLELQRHEKALAYHIFGAAPVVGLATLSLAHGCDFMTANLGEPQIASLLRKTIEGEYKPEIFVDAVAKYAPEKPAKRYKMEVSGSNSVRPLINLVRVFPNSEATETNINAFLRKNLPGQEIEVGNSFNQNLGGKLRALAKAVEEMKKLNAPGNLRSAGLCAVKK